MRARTLPAVSLTAALAVLPFGVTACGSDGGTGNASGGIWQSQKASDGTAESRQLVQNYLDAMTAKNVAKGREQLCGPLRDAFDKTAAGANGDFGKGFTVEDAKVTGVQAASGKNEVSASVTVAGKSRKAPVAMVFTVTNADGWCIANEAIRSSATPTPAAS